MLTLFFLSFLGPRLLHMEVPRLGVELKLYLPAYTTARAIWDPSRNCKLHHSWWQRRLLYPWARPRIEPTSSWILVGFVNAEPWWELLWLTVFKRKKIVICQIVTDNKIVIPVLLSYWLKGWPTVYTIILMLKYKALFAFNPFILHYRKCCPYNLQVAQDITMHVNQEWRKLSSWKFKWAHFL